MQRLFDLLLGTGSKPWGTRDATEPAVGMPKAVATSSSKPQLELAAQNAVDLPEKSFGSFFVERGVARAALKQIHSGVRLQIVGDYKLIIDGLLSNAQCNAPDTRRFMKLAHTALQMLIQTFRVNAPMAQELAQQVTRKDNSAADALANLDLDSGSFMQSDVNEVANLSLIHI